KQSDPELVHEVETMMREELRDMIRNDAPVAQINQQVDAIILKMDTVAKIVPEFGILAMIILSVALFSIIGLTARSRLSIRL
ncbi:MAG: PEFG-CTERM sorting domain-containing protein, partial [Nitrosarchaeum sp.]